MHILKIITFVLVLIGAINWGLVGAFGIDLVALIFGDMTLLVGVSAIIYAITAYRDLSKFD